MASRWVIYRRISKDRTGTSGSPAVQEKECRRLARERGYAIAEVYTDVDRSAYKLDAVRPAYTQLLADMAAGGIDGVLVWKLDRLMRRIVEFSRFWAVAEAHDVALVSKHDPVDTTTPLGLAVVYLLVGFAENESRNTSIRWKARHLDIAENGQPSGGGRRPFGFADDKVTLVPHEADAIRDAAARVLAGDSVRSIVYDWRNRGIETVNGGQWTTSTVRGLLKSGRISGQREHHGKVVAPAAWPAIITPDDTARLRAVFADPARNLVGGRRARAYLLSGVLVCGVCGAKLVTQPSRGRPRYACVTDRRGCGKLGISGEFVDEFVTEVLLTRLDGPPLAALIKTAEGRDVAVTAGQVQALEDKLEALARDHYVDELISRPEFLAARAPLERQLTAAREELARARPPDALAGVPATAGALREAWAGWSLDRRRAVLGTVIESVTVGSSAKTGNRFDPGRLMPPRGDIVWRV